MNELIRQLYLRQTRRSFLGAAARGIGGMALASLIDPSLVHGAPATTHASTLSTQPSLMHSRGVVNPLDFAPKAKRVIHLYMAGGPSHLETFDYKPKLAEMHGKAMPDS